MQIPIMAGMTAKDGAFAASYPVNLEPRAFDSGVSKGQLVTTRGAVLKGTGPGADRGGYNWNGAHYRVMGSKLCRIDSGGTLTQIGDVGDDTQPVGFAESFDRLGVRSGGALFYYDGSSLVQVTDPDLGLVLDLEWMDGYFVTTDGVYVVVTDLLDPTSVSPLKYGSPEVDPDPVTGVMRFAEELYAFGRYTIQVFDNTAGVNFPFSAVQGATIPYGCISATAKCRLGNSFAFIGGGRDEPLGLFVGGGQGAERISTREVEALIANEANPALIVLEARAFEGEKHILIHLSDRTVGVSLNTSAEAQDGAWYVLQSDGGPYRQRWAVLVDGAHWVGDPVNGRYGTLETGADWFGEAIDWQFDAALLFNDGAGLLASEVELFGQFPSDPGAVFLSMTRDGVLWTKELARRLSGRRDERVIWRIGARCPTLAGFRWRGKGRVSLSRAEMQGEPLG